MRWVEQAAVRPHRCAAIPYLGNANAGRGFIDTGCELDGFDNHVYVSVEAVEEMARLIGWAPPVNATVHTQKAERLERQLHDMTMQRNALRRQLDAVEVLRAGGYTTARKPGRPPKQKQEAA